MRSIVESEFVEVSEYLFDQDGLILFITLLVKELNGLDEELYLFDLFGVRNNLLLPFRITHAVNTTLRVLGLTFGIRPISSRTGLAGTWQLAVEDDLLPCLDHEVMTVILL